MNSEWNILIIVSVCQWMGKLSNQVPCDLKSFQNHGPTTFEWWCKKNWIHSNWTNQQKWKHIWKNHSKLNPWNEAKFSKCMCYPTIPHVSGNCLLSWLLLNILFHKIYSSHNSPCWILQQFVSVPHTLQLL